MSDTKQALSRAVSRRSFLATSAIAGASIAGSGALLAACGGGTPTPTGSTSGGAGGQVGGSVTWGAWANPGEAEIFKKFSADYQARSGTKMTFQAVVGDYASKLLTQLSGNTAPDAFYVNDALIAKAIESNVLEELSAHAEVKADIDATYPGLVDWTKSSDGGVYGVDVDCNPLGFWFNKKLLTAAGVTQDPVAAFNAGTWTRDAVTDLLTKVKATGKRGLILRKDYGDLFSWVTALGGTAFDDSGKPVFDTDPKAQTALEWLLEQTKSGNIAYGGTLPKGQGVEALFYAGQVATCTIGRWLFPNLKKLKSTIEYDVAAFPSESGKDVMPVIVYTACMSVYKNTKNKEAALAFLAYYCGKEGQQKRLSGGGNAVPSIPGLEDIAGENNDPPNGKVFNDLAAKGYAIPQAMIKKPTTFSAFHDKLDALMLNSSTTAKSLAEGLVSVLNA